MIWPSFGGFGHHVRCNVATCSPPSSSQRRWWQWKWLRWSAALVARFLSCFGVGGNRQEPPHGLVISKRNTPRYVYIYIYIFTVTIYMYMNRCCSMGKHDTKSWDGTHVGWSFTLIVAIWRFPTMVVPQKLMVCNGKSYLIGRLVATPRRKHHFSWEWRHCWKQQQINWIWAEKPMEFIRRDMGRW